MKKSTIIRTALLVLALVNQCLSVAGKSPIPVSDEQLSEAISLVFTIATSLAAWWRNNSFTRDAISADEYLEELRSLPYEDK